MKTLLATIVLASLSSSPAPASAGVIEAVPILVLAADKCPGQNYRTRALLNLFEDTASLKGWSPYRTNEEARRRALDALRVYWREPVNFCSAARRLRSQYQLILLRAGAI